MTSTNGFECGLLDLDEAMVKRGFLGIKQALDLGIKAVMGLENTIKSIKPEANQQQQLKDHQFTVENIRASLQQNMEEAASFEQSIKGIINSHKEFCEKEREPDGNSLPSGQAVIQKALENSSRPAIVANYGTVDEYTYYVVELGKNVSFVMQHKANEFLFANSNTTIHGLLNGCPIYKTIDDSQELVRNDIGRRNLPGISLITTADWDALLGGNVGCWYTSKTKNPIECPRTLVNARSDARAAIRKHMRNISLARFEALESEKVKTPLCEKNSEGHYVLNLKKATVG